ncbi:hypothetical protein CC86DRAFT_366803 [Ophiobolus disseminans]|uniref:RING-type domain-containing protein n=1 Tax=Ophiobolus disseminans TaxID=1469910 RepID=A0A6A7ADQ3_9PLEO|nr:hypothetical protein CC86DRAFT_366803 [Ophiobolus disseminans]
MAAVAHMSSPHDVHPLLRHPRPITRDSAKAQRMLGLIADTEEKSSGLHREKSKTTKWLERPMYAHLDLSDVESEKEDVHEEDKSEAVSRRSDDDEDADRLAQWTEPDRSTSFSSEDAEKLDTSFNKRRPVPLKSLRPISYNSQHLLSPEWTASPTTMSPNTQRPRPLSLQPSSPGAQRSSFSSTSSSGSVPRFLHPQTWPAPVPQHQGGGRVDRPVSYQPPSSSLDECTCSSLGSPQAIERRPRPTSFANFQHRDRRNSKIASSRGLRNNSYPNFSRPISDPPKVVPGESIETDAVYNRFANVEVGPPSPAPIRGALDGFEISNAKSRDEKKSKHRWSTIPSTLKNFTMRRSSTTAQDQTADSNIDNLRRMNLTEENLRYAGDANRTIVTSNPAKPGGTLLPTPSYSPLDFKHPFIEAGLPPPFAPWANAPPSPALTHDKRRGSEMSLSPTRQRQSRLSVENIVISRPVSMHSRNSSSGMPSPGRQMPPSHMQMNYPASPRPGSSRRGTPSLERTCIICKTTKEPTAFITRRIAANCWHEPATCYQCLQAHIEKCVTTQGWEQCTCPECGERLTYEDMGAFADDDNTSVRWED